MKIIRIFSAILIGALVSSRSQASVIVGAAGWNFDGPTAYSGVVPYNANTLNATVFKSGSMSTVRATSNDKQGAGAGDGGLTALQFTANTGSSKNVNNSFFVLTLTIASGVTALSSITINYNYLATSKTGTALNTWALSGAATGTKTVSITQNGIWDSASVTFSGLALGAGNTITFRDTLTGYGNGGGNIAEFDNISFDTTIVTPVPEPMAYALPLFGLVFIGGKAGRFYLGRMRNPDCAKSSELK